MLDADLFVTFIVVVIGSIDPFVIIEGMVRESGLENTFWLKSYAFIYISCSPDAHKSTIGGISNAPKVSPTIHYNWTMDVPLEICN